MFSGCSVSLNYILVKPQFSFFYFQFLNTRHRILNRYFDFYYFRDISVDDYFLLVESLDTEVVAFAPMLASHHPRVIAVGEGNGNLLRVTLLLSEDCRSRRNVVSNKAPKYNISPLASALATVEVDFNSPNDIVNKHEVVQNDGIYRREKSKFSNSGGDLADIIGSKVCFYNIYFLNKFCFKRYTATRFEPS